MHLRPLVTIVTLSALPFVVSAGLSPSAASPLIQSEKKVITSADQLPRRTYAIDKLPSELIEGPKSQLDAVVEQVDRDTANDLETLDIRDRAARASMLGARAQIA